MRKQVSELVRTWLWKKNLTVFFFLLLYIITEGLLLYNRQADILPAPVAFILGALPLIFLTFFFANLLVRVLSPKLSRMFYDEIDAEQRILVVKMFNILIYIVAIGFLLYTFGATIASLLTFLGFVSIGMALAVREPVLSFFSWLIILNKRPLRLGEYVRIGPYEGKVDRIGTFYLTLSNVRRRDEKTYVSNQLVKIPNKLLLDNYIENFGSKNAELTLRVHLKKIPKDIDKEMIEIQKLVAKNLEREIEKVTVGLDTFDDKTYVVIKYIVPLDSTSQFRTQILSCILTKKKKLFA